MAIREERLRLLIASCFSRSCSLTFLSALLKYNNYLQNFHNLWGDFRREQLVERLLIGVL